MYNGHKKVKRFYGNQEFVTGKVKKDAKYFNILYNKTIMFEMFKKIKTAVSCPP